MRRVVGILLVCLLGTIPVGIFAQAPSRASVKLDKKILSDKKIWLYSISNRSEEKISIYINGEQIENIPTDEGVDNYHLMPGHNFHYNKECESVKIEGEDKKTLDIWTKHDTKAEWKKLHPTEIVQPEMKVAQQKLTEKSGSPKKIVESKPIREEKRLISSRVVEQRFYAYCDNDGYYSEEAVEEFLTKVEDHLQILEYKSNVDDKRNYIECEGLEQELQVWEREYLEHNESRYDFIDRFLKRYDGYELESYDECCELIETCVGDRLKKRSDAIKDLQSVVSDVLNEAESPKEVNWIQIAMLGGTLLIIVLLIVWFVKTKDKKVQSKSGPRAMNKTVGKASPSESTIVVRRKTTTILKTQSLDDVKDNESYIRIDSQEYSQNSAVRYMYLKNSCIKDIYAMYAADLRNPNNPNEDGCMVLGRWVYDETQKVYDVSLEYVVLPGDDAVFKEYELNFGGKIKLRVAEKLRKLRTDTNLQYDLTCWIHSHPGLGVFFSNSDSNVQMQLKHPTHPQFLTAIVVDILTPQQEMGIFTFKHDGTVNAKTDLMKMYSLEELYQWAVDSERRIEAAGENYRLLSKAQKRYQDCYEISMSNSAIIDLTILASRAQTGTIAWIQGFKTSSQNNTTFVVSTVSTARPEMGLNNDLIGCVAVDTHCSIPSIRKMLAKDMANIDFVLVYSTSDNKITTIPLDNQGLSMDENYYGEANLEDLKIWTRRRR